MNFRDLTPEAHVRYMYGKGGLQPGGYTKRLIELIMHADKKNLEDLRKIYPEYVEAVEKERGY